MNADAIGMCGAYAKIVPANASAVKSEIFFKTKALD